MEYRRSEIKAGLFMAVSLVLFIAFLFAIKGVSGWERKEIYRCRFSYVGGIEPGSIVRFAGVPVGHVQAHRVLPGGEPPVELDLEIERGTPVRRDSYAYITSIGLLGAYYVEITSGTPGEPLLGAGALLSSRDITGFAQMSGSMESATSEATELLRRINELLNQENRQNLSSLITSLNAMTVQNSSELRSLLANLNALTVSLNTTAQSINGFLAANDSSMQRTVGHTEAILAQSRDLTAQLNTAVRDLDQMVVSNRRSYQETLDNLLAISRNMTEFTQTIKEQPWNLVRKSYPAERELPEK